MDLKPSNVMVERAEDGRFRPFVMDFGVAHDTTAGAGLTHTGALLGTPQYMSPEQARGDIRRIDRRSDVYSLGGMLYELLVGRPPFEGNSVADTLMNVLNADPVPLRTRDPDLPADLETITLKCLQKEPAQRYESAKALAQDLMRYLNNEPLEARRISLVKKLYLKARRQKLLFALCAALCGMLIGMVFYAVRNHLERRERERQSQWQAELATRLGQEIKDMEWMLRSSRQLKLHDLEREKVIIRKRMQHIQTELLSYGPTNRGLAYYALGHGHMALHEYPEALMQLRRAIAHGHRTASVHYALGYVLGKHFEQAMYEARLAGGGDWARKQLQDIERKYLAPAIVSLQASRTMKMDAPQYLEALIAFYQHDYDTALKQAESALRESPWLYEASKLAGDVHLERALQARDSGQYQRAELEFALSIKSYETAAAIGQSDAEPYAGLAEAWVRQIEMAIRRGQPAEDAYIAAIAASDKISVVEPTSLEGPLKKSFASMMTMAVSGVGLSSAERVQTCLAAARIILDKHPKHPYASDAAANCNLFAAELARSEGKDPEPFFFKALDLLAPVLKKDPHFLWGRNDLGNVYLFLGLQKQLHGHPSARALLEKALEQYTAAAALDVTYLTATVSILNSLVPLISETRSIQEIHALLSQSDDWFNRCKSLNAQEQQCYNNHFRIYGAAAHRVFMAGLDPAPMLQVAFASLSLTRQLGGSLLDAEQYAALSHLTAARDSVHRHQDPVSALTAMHDDLTRCFSAAPQDPMCRTLAAQSEWVQADWLATENKPTYRNLHAARTQAMRATASPEPYPDAWQTLAETHLRLARIAKHPKVRDAHINEGFSACQRVLAINANHSLGLATQGALYLLRANLTTVAPAREVAQQSAQDAFQRARKHDPLLTRSYGLLLQSGQESVSAKPLQMSLSHVPDRVRSLR